MSPGIWSCSFPSGAVAYDLEDIRRISLFLIGADRPCIKVYPKSQTEPYTLYWSEGMHTPGEVEHATPTALYESLLAAWGLSKMGATHRMRL